MIYSLGKTLLLKTNDRFNRPPTPSDHQQSAAAQTPSPFVSLSFLLVKVVEETPVFVLPDVIHPSISPLPCKVDIIP